MSDLREAVARAIREAPIRSTNGSKHVDPDVALTDGEFLRADAAIAAITAWNARAPAPVPADVEGLRTRVMNAGYRCAGFEEDEHMNACFDAATALRVQAARIAELEAERAAIVEAGEELRSMNNNHVSQLRQALAAVDRAGGHSRRHDQALRGRPPDQREERGAVHSRRPPRPGRGGGVMRMTPARRDLLTRLRGGGYRYTGDAASRTIKWAEDAGLVVRYPDHAHRKMRDTGYRITPAGLAALEEGEG